MFETSLRVEGRDPLGILSQLFALGTRGCPPRVAATWPLINRGPPLQYFSPGQKGTPPLVRWLLFVLDSEAC